MIALGVEGQLSRPGHSVLLPQTWSPQCSSLQIRGHRKPFSKCFPAGMLFFNLSGARESWEVTDRRGPGLTCHLQLLSLLLPQNNYLEATVTDTEQQGELALKDNQAKLLELSEAPAGQR